MSESVTRWIENEFSRLDFGDIRLENRFRQIITDLSHVCDQTISSSLSTWAKIKACYRFLANPKVSMAMMLAPHIQSSLERIAKQETVLLLQDSTYLDYNNRPGTSGLDLTFRSKLSKASTGLILHNTLAVNTKGIPLGLLDQRFIDRKSFSGRNFEEKRRIRSWNRPVSQKESARWINVVKKCHQIELGTGTKTIHVAD